MDCDVAKSEWEKAAIELDIPVSFERALKLKDIVFEEYAVPLQEDIIISRREDPRYVTPDKDGKYVDKALLSTSIYEYANIEDYGNEISYILIPKGTKIIYLENITKTPNDFEILWPPGTELNFVMDIGSHKKMFEL